MFDSARQKVSIHAPVKGATLRPGRKKSTPKSFNSRTRKGCDAILVGSDDEYNVSIHAPVKGATQR